MFFKVYVCEEASDLFEVNMPKKTVIQVYYYLICTSRDFAVIFRHADVKTEVYINF